MRLFCPPECFNFSSRSWTESRDCRMSGSCSINWRWLTFDIEDQVIRALSVITALMSELLKLIDTYPNCRDPLGLRCDRLAGQVLHKRKWPISFTKLMRIETILSPCSNILDSFRASRRPGFLTRSHQDHLQPGACHLPDCIATNTWGNQSTSRRWSTVTAPLLL